ncbi:MAG: hypothetical protein IPJ17_10475 [Holophagales bacterium]|nr:MAG: hypothetical protein IPJ17_10475 [Holophagales bacterium]
MAAELVARVVVAGSGVYVGVGVVLALAHLGRGLARLDPAARGASVGFRLIVVPGLVALWPLLARRLFHDSPPPVERTAHRRAVEGAVR